MHGHMHIKIVKNISRQPVGTVVKGRAWTARPQRSDKHVFPKRRVEYHQTALRNIPEERGHHLH